MSWWQRMVVPVKRALGAVAARVKSKRDGGGILKLHDDVQSCEYRDVQVMWEILQRSEQELAHISKHKEPFGRVSVWSGRSSRSN